MLFPPDNTTFYWASYRLKESLQLADLTVQNSGRRRRKIDPERTVVPGQSRRSRTSPRDRDQVVDSDGVAAAGSIP